MKLSARALASALSGSLDGPDVVFDGASIDTRTLRPGVLFVPILGERDGHDYVAEAVGAGAVCYLDGRRRGHPRAGTASVIRVDDTARALADAGRHARKHLEGLVVGITGSVGKTSAKDLIAAAFAVSRRTHSNPASFNNELGLPLTVLNAPDHTEVTVLEMGARGAGHIAMLCEIGRPTIGVVTRVALAHGEQFGSIEGVARAKGELVEALPADGVAVLNAGDERVAAMARRTAARVMTFGVEQGDVAVHHLTLDGGLRPRFTLLTPDGPVELMLEARGAHVAQNAAAAMATALAGGVAIDDAAEGMASARLSPWRMEVETTRSGALVINDAYNANPTSVEAALDALVALDHPRRTAVLGIMAELGPEAERHHRDVAERTRALGVRLIAVAAPAYGDLAEHVPDADAAAEVLGDVDERDAVLVKGSRVAGLERLAARLLDLAPRP